MTACATFGYEQTVLRLREDGSGGESSVLAPAGRFRRGDRDRFDDPGSGASDASGSRFREHLDRRNQLTEGLGFAPPHLGCEQRRTTSASRENPPRGTVGSRFPRVERYAAIGEPMFLIHWPRSRILLIYNQLCRYSSVCDRRGRATRARRWDRGATLRVPAGGFRGSVSGAGLIVYRYIWQYVTKWCVLGAGPLYEWNGG